MIDRCICQRCEGFDTGAWEDEEDWLSKAYRDEEQYYKEEAVRRQEEMDRDWAWYLQVCREDDECPNCGESPWDTEVGPCTKCLAARET